MVASKPRTVLTFANAAFLNLSLSSALCRARSSVDHASKFGVKYVAQAGGSNGDAAVTAAADEYGMAMCHTGIRLFHH